MEIEMESIIFVILVGQAFVNIGYLINFATRLAKVETHLVHLMRAEGVPVND